MILAIGVFDLATRPMNFKINGNTAIKVHKVHPLIRVLWWHESRKNRKRTMALVSDFKDYILHFEQVAIWNKWSDTEKAQQLVMCLRGQAQNILSDLTLGKMN